MSSQSSLAPMHAWLAAPMDQDAAESIERLRRAPDVQQIAVMPDVHLGTDVCIGVVIATSRLIYPQAVGGDIGCGMFAVAFDAEAGALNAPRIAGQVLSDLGRAIPARRRNRNATIAQPGDLVAARLSHPTLESMRRTEGALEFATLGSGNHFLEFQSDDEGRLWLMIHSGSRGLGQAIRDHHHAQAQPVDGRLRALDGGSDAGAAYLNDAAWARRYADASRRAMAEQAAGIVSNRIGAHVHWDLAISTDHNHVALERHGEAEAARDFWIHRKGAMPAAPGQPGVLPGSMGTLSFHVEGRGHPAALCSSAHGAGRALSRTAARHRFSERDLRRQMSGVWFDTRLAAQLRDEAPAAYKDIRAVLRAQSDLVKVTRTLRPILNYKGV